ncbi:MAG: hypothetical protein ACKVI2_04260 [Candidatus Pelagibacterales bacterium]|jgi:hypothetical protein
MIKHITETEALDFASKQEHKDNWHKDFYYWKRHLLALKNWPWLKKFYKGGNWLGHFDDKLNGIYWYNLQGDEIYDGFLISSKLGVGIRLGRWLEKNIKYKTNWSCCSKRYVKFNERLGFEIKSMDNIEEQEVFLLCRKKY